MCPSEEELLIEAKEVQEEILKHKWFESEKAGYDIGFNPAAFDWIIKYYDEWKRQQILKPQIN